MIYTNKDAILMCTGCPSVLAKKDIDMDDIAFVALSKYLDGIKLWTGDKKLLEGIKAKGFNNGLSTDELVQLRKSIERKISDK